MAQFTLNDHEYATRKLDVRKQAHVVRRIAPALTSLVSITLEDKKRLEEAGLPTDGAGVSVEKFMGPMLRAIGDMDDSDFDFVVNTCLAVVTRQQGNGWAPVRAGGEMAFDDIDLMEMLQLVGKVIQESLGRFFPNPATNGSTSAPVAAPL